MSDTEVKMEPSIVIVEMTTTQYFLLVLASCVLWGVIGALFFFVNESGGWHDFGAIVLFFDAVIAGEVLLCLLAVSIFGDGPPVRTQMLNPNFGQPISS